MLVAWVWWRGRCERSSDRCGALVQPACQEPLGQGGDVVEQPGTGVGAPGSLLSWRPPGGGRVTLTRGHILVVEDDEGMRDVLCDLLHEAGYDVTTAGNGEEALDALGELGAGDDGPDLIVLDH